MKKELIISLCLGFFGCGILFFTLRRVPSHNKSLNQKPQPFMNQSQQEVQNHKDKSDCWIIVENNIYDVTAYLPKHPDQGLSIIPLCGTDATVAFQTKGGKGTHSPKAQQTLKQYVIKNSQ